MLRDDFTLQISSIFVAVTMKESLFVVDKKLLSLVDWTVSAIDVKTSLKVFAIAIGSLMYFSSFLIIDGVSFFLCFIHSRDLIPIQVFLISLMSSLKNLVKFFFSFEKCRQEISVGLIIIVIRFFKLLVFTFYKVWVYIILF